MRYRRRRTRTSSGTLLVTFFLGLGLGFSLCYAMLEVLDRDTTPQDGVPGPVAEGPVTEPPAVPEPPPPAELGNTPAVPPAPEPPAPQEALPVVPPWSAANLVMALPAMPSDDDFALLAHFAPAGVVLPDDAFASPDQVPALCMELRGAVQPVPVILARLDAAVNALDNAATLRELGDGPVESARATAELWGRALRAMGIDVVLGPRLGAYQGGPVPPESTFGTDPGAIIAHGTAVIEGLREGGVVPVAMDYPGLASAAVEGGIPVLGAAGDIDGLVALMKPFAIAIQEGVPAVMVAHVSVPAIEADNPPPPASFSRKLVYQLLRERRAYQGPILGADVTALPEAVAVPPQVAAVAALAAGCDVVVMRAVEPAGIARVCSAIAATVEEGILTRAGLEESRLRFTALTEGLPEPVPPPAIAEMPPAAPPVPPAEAPPAEPTEETEAPGEAASATEPPAPVESEPEPEPEAPVAETGPPPGTVALTHSVARGETLTGIAGRYGVSLSDIRKWNDMAPDDVLKFGAALTVYVPEDLAESLQAPPEPPAPAPEPEPEPEPAPSPQPTPAQRDLPPQPPGTTHEAVVFGDADTLARIAERFRVSVEDIRAWNGIQGRPQVGEVLHIFPPKAEAQPPATPSPAPAPPPAEPEGNYDSHVIQVGDTLHSIAVAHGTTVQELVRINNLRDPNHVQLGQRLRVPAAE